MRPGRFKTDPATYALGTEVHGLPARAAPDRIGTTLADVLWFLDSFAP